MVIRSVNDKPANNVKGLERAEQHFDAGDISQIQYSKVNDTLIYIRAYCMASFKKQKYQVFLCYTYGEQLSFAYCQCTIGLGQSCSHVGALLFALHALGKCASFQGESCTSRPCQWNVPRALKLKATPLSEWNLRKPCVASCVDGDFVKKPLEFDPRHPSQRDFDINHGLQFLQELKQAFPNTGMAQLWNIPDVTPDAVMEEVVETSIDPQESSMQLLVFCEENLPIPTFISTDLSTYIEKRTRGQRSNMMWQSLHRGRITSSLFGAVLHAGPSPDSLVRQILHGSDLEKYSSLPKAIQWGVDNEKIALQNYIDLQSRVTEVKVTPAGLTLYPSHSFLGASSDGWVTDSALPDDIRTGCLEIKCPYSIKNEVIVHKEVADLLSYRHFCLETTGEGRVQLRCNHPYYAQVQGEMAIMGVTWCDFVVWTKSTHSNCFIERIHFDSVFVSAMMPVLQSFYVKHIL